MTGLVLAGTYEARMLCAELATLQIPAIASLAGVTRKPEDLGIDTRIGGFGGVQGFETYLKQENIKWVIDATHPFATNMTATATTVCAALELPHMVLQRPEWSAGPQDQWHFIDHVTELDALLPNPATVFLGTGRQTLSDYGILKGRRFLCRVVDDPQSAFPFEGGAYLIGRPPFSVEEEIDILKTNKIDWLVVKNSGGSGGFAKLAAAAQLGLPVAMFNRTVPKNMTLKTDVSATLEWLKSQLS